MTYRKLPGLSLARTQSHAQVRVERKMISVDERAKDSPGRFKRQVSARSVHETLSVKSA